MKASQGHQLGCMKEMKNLLRYWLFHQCQILAGSTRAVLLSGPPGQGPFDRTLFWPDTGGDHSVLLNDAAAALHNNKPLILTRNKRPAPAGKSLDTLTCPLHLNGQLLGAVAIEMTHRSQLMQQAALQQVIDGSQWLKKLILLNISAAKQLKNTIRQTSSAARQQLVNLVDLVAVGLEHEKFRVAATEVANELAGRFGCRRVSLGFLHFSRIRVEVLSSNLQIEPQAHKIRAIRDAMGESLDQNTTVVYPAASDDARLVNRFHAQLAKEEQGAAICTVPLIKNGKAVGALLLERAAEQSFTAETVAQCEQISLLLGPVLETRRREERPLPIKILDSIQGWGARLFGPRALPLKVGVALSVLLLAWLSLASSTFSISSDAVLEPEICRTVVAPQEGYIAAAHVRAGDQVRKGDLLATLDDQKLRQEQRKWQSQRAQLFKEYRKALAGWDRAEVAILRAKQAQAEAQLKLVEQQLARVKLVAPFAGLVVKGDLNQALGAPVKRGEVLYEVAPTNEYRAVLKVDDRDIGMIAAGQRGQLKLSGIPNRSVNIIIDRLTPVSSTADGRNFFRVEAIMDQHLGQMRPGMEGVAKIEISQEKLLWIWTRRLVDWLRLFIWNRLP
jgi:RND family efflux transporter MFP subunit